MTAPSRTANSWTRKLVAAPNSAFRLVCFPYAGGSASYFRPLAIALAPHVETLAVQYPGRQDRRAEAPLESVGQLADAACEVLHGLPPGPFALFGHSLGALVAFEAARRLEAGGAYPAHLFASAASAPSVLRAPTVHLTDDDALIAALGELGGTDRSRLATARFRTLSLPAVRADYRAVARYRPEPGAHVACPLTVLMGSEDPVVAAGDAAAWRDHTTADVAHHIFEGGHFYLDRHIAAVARTIAGALVPRLPPPAD